MLFILLWTGIFRIGLHFQRYIISKEHVEECTLSPDTKITDMCSLRLEYMFSNKPSNQSLHVVNSMLLGGKSCRLLWLYQVLELPGLPPQ